jgi:outer membrane murein-binding lipoprotein Lpp
MESRRDVISELSWKIENLEREIEQLESQKYTAEAYAADAIRMANKRDPTVEDLTKWQVIGNVINDRP